MAAVQPTVQLPQSYNLLGSDGKLTQQWYFFFQQLLKALPPVGASGVTTTTPPMNINWGLDINKGTPTAGNVYLAYDTGKVYIGDGSTYHIEFPAINGDATKPVGSSTLTLNTVNFAPGTYGDSFNIPRISVNNKGLVTNVIVEPLGSGSVPAAGSTGMVQWNNAGVLGASGSFTYSVLLDQVSVTNLLVQNTIQDLTFSPNSFLFSGATRNILSTVAVTNGQLLIGSTGASPVAATLTAGSGVNITNGAGSITVDNTGVLSLVAGTNITLSAGTGNVTVNAVPTGSDTQVQFNNAGVFGGSSSLTWDGTSLSATEVKISAATGSDGLVFANNSAVRGNFSSGYGGTGSKRVYIQTTTPNSRTLVPIIPLGTPATGQYTGIQVFENQDPNNSGIASFGITSSTAGPPSTTQICKILGQQTGTGVAPAFGWTFKNTVMGGDSISASTFLRLNGLNSNANFYIAGGFNSSGDDTIFFGTDATSPAPSISFGLQTRGPNGIFIISPTPATDPGQLQINMTGGAQGLYAIASDNASTPTSITLNGPTNNSSLYFSSGALSTGDDNCLIQAYGSATNVGIQIATQGSGLVNITGNNYPNNTGTSGQYLQTDGAGNLSWQNTAASLTSTYVGFGDGSNNLTGDGTFTYSDNLLSIGDGTNIELTTIQLNADGGDFVKISIAGSDQPFPGALYVVAPKGIWLDSYGPGTAGQVLTSQGTGAEVNWTTPAIPLLTTGTASYVAGVAIVTTAAVTAASVPNIAITALGTVLVPQMWWVSSIIAGTSFTITSADPTDTSTFNWTLIN